MKMKKFFSSKSRKKKATGNLARQVKAQDAVGSQEPLLEKNGKKRKTKKGARSSAEQNRAQPPFANGKDSTALATNGVVLRRCSHAVNADQESHLRSPAHRRDSRDDPRLPGSESSSRTPSSASTSSHQRWSSRRPLSWVESLQGQALEEDAVATTGPFTRASRNNAVPLSGTATLPAGMKPNYDDFAPRPRTTAMDFNFFRFFRRSTRSKSPDGSESESGASLASSGRGSFRLKVFKISRREKRQGSRGKLEQQTSSASTSSEVSRRRSSSIIVVEEEGENSGATVSACESVNATPVRDLTQCNKTLPEPLARSCSDSYQRGARTADRESVSSECSHCQSLVRGDSENGSASSVVQVSVVDDEPVSYDAASGRRRIARPYSTPCSVLSYASASSGGAANSRELLEVSPSASNAATLGSSGTFGGSLICLNRRRGATSSSTSALPRHRSQTEMPLAQRVLSKKAMYASFPQLPSSANNDSSPKQSSLRMRGTVRFEEEEDEESEKRPSPDARSEVADNPTVDSPIKRAIAYPADVILRRRQKKRLGKSSSTDLLTGDRRAKQVLSLNMEDLPTYGEMREDELRWRSASMMHSSATRNRTATDSVASSIVDQVRFRAALMYQRYASHSTSVDDISDMHKMLSKHKSWKDFYNLDDDEFLDMYLSTPPNVAPSTEANHAAAQVQEPSSKRVKNLRKSVASFANLISPGKPGRLKRSSSFSKESSTPAFKPYRPPGSNQSSADQAGHTPGRRANSGGNAKNRRSRLWCETFDHSGLDERELKRQEAIFELYQGENDLVQDLRMAKQTYRDSMVTLKMLTEDEVNRIFGKLDCLLPLHEDLLGHLISSRAENGRTEAIGHVFVDWFPTLSPYEEYCANQADAKETLDAVIGREARVRDFLQRCLESPFSRKLDLWSYLDLPRSKLVKYPLLLKNILKATPADHPDTEHLEKALLIINDIIGRVDDLTGERQCRFFLSKFEYLDEKQRCSYVDESRNLICSGQLKSNRGTKLHVFLFDLAMILTRNATRGGKLTYQVYRHPLSLRSLVIEGEEGGKLSGSFRGGILGGDKAKHSFRVRDEDQGNAYTLIATDEHDRKQWLNSISEAIAKCRGDKATAAGPNVANPRRASSDKSASSTYAKKEVPAFVRSSSAKAEMSVSESRNRSMTINSLPVHANKEAEKQKRFKVESPLARRRSKTMSVAQADGPEEPESKGLSPEVRLRTKAVGSKKNLCRRSRSLTSSPISLFASLPRRTSRAGVARSESCNGKPPTGRTPGHGYSLRSVAALMATPPRSPGPLQPARSTPDLFMNRSRTDLSVLEEVKGRLGVDSDDLEPVRSDHNKLLGRHGHLVPNLLIDSPEHPVASDTSRCFPVVEEESVSPQRKSLVPSPLRSSSSSPVISSFVRSGPVVAWSDAETTSHHDDVISDVEASSSSVSNGSATPVECPSTDLTPTAETLPEDVTLLFDNSGVVCDVLNRVVDKVCAAIDYVVTYENVTCHGDYITVTDDDGMPWLGNDLEADA